MKRGLLDHAAIREPLKNLGEAAEREIFAAFDAAGQLVLRYEADASGTSSNPNGAMGNVAGVCDETGRILGLMPHPERFLVATQHPSWNGRLDGDAFGAGLAIFASAVKAVS